MKKITKYISTTFAILSLLAFSACNFNNSSDDSVSGTIVYYSNGNLNSNWSYEGKVTVGTDEVYNRWTDENYNNWATSYLPADTHGDVLNLTLFLKDNDKYYLNPAKLTISDITPATDSYLVFEYKTSFLAAFPEGTTDFHSNKPYYTEQNAQLYVDNQFVAYIGANGNTIWRTKGVKLTAGQTHSVSWAVNQSSENTRFCDSFENSLYLDNIKLIPASEFEKVDISPKGQQDTVVNKPLKFTASANWTETKPTFTSSGGSIDTDGNFIATTPGTYTVQASLDGKNSMAIFVTVHAENYLETEKSFTLPGYLSDGSKVTFTGAISNEGTNTVPENCSFNGNTYPLSSIVTFDSPTPTKSEFSADGFFVIKGRVNYPLVNNYDKLYLYVYYHSNHDTYLYSSYPLEENFYKRVWLPFDNIDDSSKNEKGYYTIELRLGKNNTTTDSNGNEITTVILTYLNTLFTVRNSNINANKISYLYYPSSFVNYDNFEVTNAVHDALYGNNDKPVPVKLQLIHDWIIHHFHYDYVSLHINNRKPQDAVSCIINNMAVCEGYASVFAAMARYCVIPTEFYASTELNHSWNIVHLPTQNFEQKLVLVDATWDDTAYDKDKSNSNIEKYPYSECYSYFLIHPDGINNDHKYPNHPEARSISGTMELTPIRINGIPDGWY